MREELVKDMKKLVDDQIEKEIKRAIKDVPMKQRGKARK